MQQESSSVSRKNALEKRHSTSGITLEHKKYPMLHMLMQENGGMPSTSTSTDDTSSTSIVSTAPTNIPPRDYDRSSLESDTVSVESYRQQRENSGTFADRYASTPPRPGNMMGIQQAAANSVSGSPPSPPFYYSSPIIWNNNAANNGFSSRGEYLIQDNFQSFLASMPHGYRGVAATGGNGELGMRPNGLVFESLPFENV